MRKLKQKKSKKNKNDLRREKMALEIYRPVGNVILILNVARELLVAHLELWNEEGNCLSSDLKEILKTALTNLKSLIKKFGEKRIIAAQTGRLKKDILKVTEKELERLKEFNLSTSDYDLFATFYQSLYAILTVKNTCNTLLSSELYHDFSQEALESLTSYERYAKFWGEEIDDYALELLKNESSVSSDEDAVVLSIKPEFVKKIFAGEKKFEFRKKIWKNKKIKRALIYCTSPVKKIVGEFKIEAIIKGSPEILWNVAKKFGGIEKDAFDDYFHEKKDGYSLKIKNVVKFERAFTLSEFGLKSAPQNFAYYSSNRGDENAD